MAKRQSSTAVKAFALALLAPVIFGTVSGLQYALSSHQDAQGMSELADQARETSSRVAATYDLAASESESVRNVYLAVSSIGALATLSLIFAVFSGSGTKKRKNQSLEQRLG